LLKKVFKFILSGLGFFSAFVAMMELFPNGIVSSELINTLIFFGSSVFVSIICYLFSSLIINNFPKMADKFESYIKERKYTMYEFILAGIGLVAGLIIANLICMPVVSIKFVGVPISLVVNLMLAYLGMSIMLRYKQDRFFSRFKKKFEEDVPKEDAKLLDTSAVIDGRIFDIILTGFIEGKIVIPQYVITELGMLADSEDNIKRAKGRRGLDLLNIMQKEMSDCFIFENNVFDTAKGVDELLIEDALAQNLSIITNDFNLNKIAQLKNIKVLNINELAGALKPLASVGDEISVLISKKGKERAQGIGYLESGTMVVIENTKDMVGETVKAVVTSVIQTKAGRMVFANLV